MRIVKLNAIDSTNNYLKALGSTEFISDFTVVTAKNQTEGKGQRGSVWSSEASKNLMFSVFKDLSSMPLEHPFYISMITSLALLNTLKSFEIPKLSVKWPNDILSANKKICGVLIENVIKQNKINASIIGIGLNVNQTSFENLPRASSLKNIANKNFDMDEILKVILSNLKAYFLLLEAGKYESIKEEYEAQLFRKNKPSTFKNAEGLMFLGVIKSVSDTGYLQVLLEDDILKPFDLKEITLLY
ncbi:biotin--[acetyl-CoA-carboxylase] ligase [Algibacter pectinivorans]|uniref:BirA family transcriptional regulator, biotin operon repressor / biotin-[acetyl-CoA-carboxylase] ligase n=1 Tax=Algibacter pectinivorans TaxID=870482 RepID=A0A1I1Q3I4_9FLAO|nr:biotin--[acetyl-CoA-carboxylase] ligase [Algibacter pectinivorans]SFD16547.1 BirA family transcriptional regulator, biotin operon repressor / biotin-[acetyl-CoA-carboxylase] ligase [Algibacter pectinivorans]